ncbi:pyridine nucleotide-disulfide oxidoreductase [Winogradskyella epiphytica]|uniref:Pyridine nucleotide-disulfide oxidoreductase n=1 Tax=Winogradskyella epiphytica TaxID=262005 RepID=A0A2V4XXI5_9FLAO|nr:pyridine nucleotide-disulfide oxidoreductase [Winogradskyella epiphytica]GGW58669.1 pyridine nucleotide-disulfide oxidoreductase [Winogradskyella epiphytica]
MIFDALIIGGGAAGLSCALILGSAKPKPYAEDKKIGIIVHQRSSHLQTALFNNVLGLPPGTLGTNILKDGKKQLSNLYPHITQIDKEKVTSIEKEKDFFIVSTNKNSYRTKLAVIAVGYTSLMTIKGLEDYTEPHPREAIAKDRIWLKNTDHLIAENLYVAGTLAGWRSQFSVACGSGSHVATDILTLWNDGKHSKVHDKAIEPL